MSKIEDYLNSMGETADEVALFLRKQGITGSIKECDFCPIIKSIYLKFPNLSPGLRVESVYYHAGYRRFGSYGYVFMEASSDVRITWGDIQTIDPTCPRAIKEFVANFDDGKYPELVGESKDDIRLRAVSKLTVEEKMALQIK